MPCCPTPASPTPRAKASPPPFASATPAAAHRHQPARAGVQGTMPPVAPPVAGGTAASRVGASGLEGFEGLEGFDPKRRKV